MFWDIHTPKCNIEIFQDREVDEVLYDFNGPKIFTTKSDGFQHFWYECAEDYATQLVRYLVVPTNKAILDSLKDGRKTVHDALSQPWIWAVDFDFDEKVIDGWVLSGLDEVPQLAKPEKDAPLYPHLVPFLAYRLIGNGIGEGTTPASVIARAVEKPMAAVKRLLESVNKTVAQGGRPVDAFRKQYDMPTQRFAWNSFEVSFALPVVQEGQQEIEMESLHDEGAKLLSSALQWLHDQDGVDEPDLNLLEVLEELVPPAHGQVEKAEIKGWLLTGASSILLDREDRKKVRHAIGKKRSERKLLEAEGRVGEFDKDNLTFTLRDIPDSSDLSCSFEVALYDDIWDAFDGDLRVTVQGKWRAGRKIVDVVAIEFIASDDDDAVEAIDK